MEGDWDKMTRENEERFTCTGWGVFSGLRLGVAHVRRIFPEPMD